MQSAFRARYGRLSWPSQLFKWFRTQFTYDACSDVVPSVAKKAQGSKRLEAATSPATLGPGEEEDRSSLIGDPEAMAFEYTHHVADSDSAAVVGRLMQLDQDLVASIKGPHISK